MRAEFTVAGQQAFLLGDDAEVRSGQAGLTITKWGGKMVISREPIYQAMVQLLLAHGNWAGNFACTGRQVFPTSGAAAAYLARLEGVARQRLPGTLTLTFADGTELDADGSLLESVERESGSGGCCLVFSVSFARPPWVVSGADPNAQ